MEIKQKDNSIKAAIIVIVIGTLIGFIATHSLFGTFRGACGGFLVALVSELYVLFKEHMP